MKTRTKEEIESEVKRIWAGSEPDGIEITQSGEGWNLRLSSMYEPPGLGFSHLSELAEFFDTKNIGDADRFNEGGCETCDYGSSYGFTLEVRP